MARTRAKQAADASDAPKIRAGNTREVLGLIDRFGFNSSAVLDELEPRSRARHVPADFELRFDVSDRATLADVWSRGIRAKQGVASNSR
jgi:hypothetical protein